MSREHDGHDGCPACPVALRTKTFGSFRLDMDVMEKLFKELHSLGYTGLTGLHHYNEPLIDKRIWDIIPMAVRLCPDAKVQIYTNGRLLNDEVGQRLMNLGVADMRVSAYSDSEYERLCGILKKLKASHPDRYFSCVRSGLDGRMDIYDAEVNDINSGCPTIREQMVIVSSGDIQLCCRDFLRKNSFGNIYKNTFTEILQDSNYLPAREDLISGKDRQKYYPCDRCGSVDNPNHIAMLAQNEAATVS